MKMLLPIAALLGTAFFQAPATPPVKMGLWESKGTMKVPQPDGTTKDTDRVTRICKTPQTWVKMMGPTAKDACPKANEVWTKDGYSFDVMCSGKPKMATVTIHFDSPETDHGTFDMSAMPDGSPRKIHSEFTEQWIGADCGDVSADHPVIVR